MVILIGLVIAGIGAGLAVGIFVGSRLLSSRRTGTTAAEHLRISGEAKRSAEASLREAQRPAEPPRGSAARRRWKRERRRSSSVRRSKASCGKSAPRSSRSRNARSGEKGRQQA